MAKTNRTFLDDLVEAARRILEELMNPQPQNQKPARVPVPVRVKRPEHDPRNQ